MKMINNQYQYSVIEKQKNSKKFKIKYDYFLKKINDTLSALVTEKDSPENTIYRAMNYSLMAGGKRLRPVLLLAVSEMLGINLDQVMPYACALEMIHTYSLIHDDLPAMDNDDYRRGILTNHKVFGDATAILAGDALLNYAFEYMLECVIDKSRKRSYSLEAGVKAISYIAKAAGVNGMIGGQIVDIESEGKEITCEQLEYIHKHKTGALIKASVMVPAILALLDEEKKKVLEKYSSNIGLAFQVKDDILDAEGDFKLLGKSTGKDARIGKSTFVSFYGIEDSREILYKLIREAVDSLQIFEEKAFFLKELAIYIAERKN